MKSNQIAQERLKSNIHKFYLFKVFSGLTLFVPVIVLFWQSNGLSLTQVMILQSLYSVTVITLEVPTGYFADIYGRKKSLIFASFFSLVSILIYSLGHNFYQFLIAEMLWAFGVSLTSGTDSAFIYDTLKDLKKEKTYKKIWGNVMFFHLIALSFGSILGGFIGKISYRWTLYATIPFVFILLPISFSFREPKRHKHIFKKGYFFELLSVLKTSLIKNRKIRWLIIYSGVIVGFNSAALWLYQPYFKLSGLDIFYFGFVFASFNIIAAIASKYAHKIEKKIGPKYSLFVLVILIAISYFLMSNFVCLFSFSFAFLQQFVRGFWRPVITDYINKLTHSKVRATVLSVQNLVGRLFYASIIPIIGWIADIYNLTQAFSILGITTAITGTLVLIFLYKSKAI